MTAKSIACAIRWQVMREDLADRERLIAALEDPRNQRRIPLASVKKKFNLP